MKKEVNVEYGYRFNQFSFSQYDSHIEDYNNHKGFPVVYPNFRNDGMFELITGFNLISDNPLYESQLEMITKGLTDLFSNHLQIDFDVKIRLEYNNYGNLFLVWKVGNKEDIDKCIDLSNNILEEYEWEKSDVLSEIVYDFFNMEMEVNDQDELETYIKSIRRLGYEDSVKEISERCGIDVSIVKKIENDLMNELQKKGENYEN